MTSRERVAIKIVIPLDGLPTLNEHDNANRSNRFSGAGMKKKATSNCALYIKKAMSEGFEFNELPAELQFDWYCKNRRIDPDNRAFSRKYIFDGMQQAGLIKNDNWKFTTGWKDNFFVDKESPRVEIYEKRSDL